jgi:hypothetical protein
MANLYQLHADLLNDDKITEDEVEVIRKYIEEDGKLDLNDVKFLVGLLSSAKEVCQEFDDLFFPVLKEVLLKDGKITMDEQFYLLKMLYSDGHVRDSEREFLFELREELDEIAPEFEALCDQIMTVPSRGWSVGGRPRG